jgi:hypothetical protein
MTDAAGRPSPDERRAEAADEFGAALERLARGHERDPERRRDLAAGHPRRALGLLGRAGDRSPAQVVALIVAGVALFGGIALFNAWTVRRLQSELDLLVE